MCAIGYRSAVRSISSYHTGVSREFQLAYCIQGSIQLCIWKWSMYDVGYDSEISAICGYSTEFSREFGSGHCPICEMALESERFPDNVLNSIGRSTYDTVFSA